jgi:surface carbohydrate biosynthesis protein
MPVYFSCEVSKREVLPRLFLAGHLARHGIGSVVGHKTIIPSLLGSAPKGVFLYKSVTPICARHYQLASSFGHRNFGLCEELLFFKKEEDTTWDKQLAPETLRLLDIYLASNSFDYQKAAEVIGSRSNLTGNMRLDFARNCAKELYSCLSESLRARYGKFCLIVSPAMIFSTPWTVTQELHNIKSRTSEQARSGPFGLLDFVTWSVARSSGYLQQMKLVLETLRSLSMLPIIRPHPGEDREFYTHLFLNRIDTAWDYDIYPWILSASAIVNYDCTTTLDAALVGRQALNISQEVMASETFGQAFDIPFSLSGLECFLSAQPARAEPLMSDANLESAFNGILPFGDSIRKDITNHILNYHTERDGEHFADWARIVSKKLNGMTRLVDKMEASMAQRWNYSQSAQTLIDLGRYAVELGFRHGFSDAVSLNLTVEVKNIGDDLFLIVPRY